MNLSAILNVVVLYAVCAHDLCSHSWTWTYACRDSQRVHVVLWMILASQRVLRLWKSLHRLESANGIFDEEETLNASIYDALDYLCGLRDVLSRASDVCVVQTSQLLLL